MIYLDSAATTLKKPNRVYESVNRGMRMLTSPGRGQYKSSETASDVLFECRVKAAKLFNVKEPDNVVFTFNATHGLNIAINTLAKRGSNVVVSGYEHNAVMRPLRHLDANVNILRTPLFDTNEAINAFDDAVTQRTDLVICTAMSNVFGYILPIYEIAEICKKKSVPLIIDASQGAGALNLDFERLGAAFMAMPGHKGLYGPQGTGLLLCSRNIKPLICGGTGGNSALMYMPDFLPDAGEAGTHNMPGIAGISAGLDYVLKMTPSRIFDYEHKLMKTCVSELIKHPELKVYYSDINNAQGGVISFTHKNIEPNEFASVLASKGVCTRAGLHCAPSAHETAGTIGVGTVRISFSAFTEMREIAEFLKIVNKVIND